MDQTETTPNLSEASPPSEVVKFILHKCLKTIKEDIESLSPKDRILLWKEYGNYFADQMDESDIPGMNIRKIEVEIIKSQYDGDQNNA